jgi:hypothetical protein
MLAWFSCAQVDPRWAHTHAQLTPNLGALCVVPPTFIVSATGAQGCLPLPPRMVEADGLDVPAILSSGARAKPRGGPDVGFSVDMLLL